MKTKSTVLLLGTIAVIIFAVVLFFINRQPILDGNFSRKWSSAKFTTVKETNLNYTILGFANWKGRVFLNRMYDVAEINNVGQTTSVFSIDTGYRPSQYIVGMDADSSGLYFQDARNRVLTKINYSNKVVSQQEYPFSIYKSVHLSDSAYLIKFGSSKDRYLNHRFMIYNPYNQSSQIVDTLMPQNSKGGIDIDGFFVRNEEGAAAHVFFYMSHASLFKSNGIPQLSFNTLDGNNPPPPVLKVANGFMTSPEARVIHPTGAIDENYLYIISKVKSRDMPKSIFLDNHVVDVYNLKSGHYDHSFLIPNTTHHGADAMLVTNGMLYLITGSKYLTILKIS